MRYLPVRDLFLLFFQQPSKKRIIFFLFIAVVSLLTWKHTQSSTGSYSVYAQQACANRPAEIIFLIDKSGSMGEPITKFNAAKNATIEFINKVAGIPTNPVTYIGAISFANSFPPDVPPNSKLEWRLTQFYGNVTRAVSNIETPGGATCISCGVFIANQQFATYKTPDRKNVVILISDGGATRSMDGHMDESDAKAETLSQVRQAVSQHGATFYTISVGPDIESDEISFLNQIAVISGGKYFRRDAGTIDEALDEIFLIYGKGSVSGYKYDDRNRDGNIDSSTEPRLGGWNIELRNSIGGLLNATTTDSTGFYKFDGLCDGSYRSNEIRKAGWDVTEPVGNNRSFSIVNGDSLLNLNFGNATALPPTNTPTPTATRTPTPTATPTPTPQTYRISGTVFIDTDGNGKISGSETAYTDTGSRVIYRNLLTGAQSTLSFTGQYSINGLLAGLYRVTYDVSLLPGGYTIFPSPPSFNVTVGPGCTYSSNVTGAQCQNNNIINLNFALRNATPWYQTESFDTRIDAGVVNKIPTDAACQSFASLPKSSSTPGVIFTGSTNADFSPGRASVRDWVVGGGGSFSEIFGSSRQLSTSYSTLLTTIRSAGVVPTPLNRLSQCGDYASCQLNPNASGAYTVGTPTNPANLTINSGDISGNKSVVVLVNGSVRINGPINVDPGSFFLITSTDDMTVSSSVGSNPSCSATPQLEGIYVTNTSFTTGTSTNDCSGNPDLMLTMAGSVVVNASRGGGQFINRRNLCSGNLNFPSVRVNERPDLLLNAPSYIQTRTTIWEEVAP